MRAIVLSRRDFREYDQLVSVFSLEKGKVIALARGVKKIVSKNSAFLEPFFFIESEVLPGREIKHLTKAVGIRAFKNIRRDYRKSLIAGRAVSLADRLLEEGQREPEIFFLLASWLDYLDKNKAGDGHYFGLMARLFKILGYLPLLDQCVRCKKKKYPAANGLFFSAAAGGLICPDCKNSTGDNAVLPLRPGDVETWQKYLFSEIDQWPPSPEFMLRRAINDFSEYHTEKQLVKIGQI